MILFAVLTSDNGSAKINEIKYSDSQMEIFEGGVMQRSHMLK